jgi:hypothetical protein
MMLIESVKLLSNNSNKQRFLNMKRNVRVPIIICGDMNSAFSYVYRNIKGATKKIVLKKLVSLGQLISSSIILPELTIFFADEKMTVKNV